jgi:type I restriction enzyme R subunit
MSLNESIVEDAALELFAGLGYTTGDGPHLAPGEPSADRANFSDVILPARLRNATHRLNPTILAEAREDALRKGLHIVTPSLTQTNRTFHRLLRDGVPVEYPRPAFMLFRNGHPFVLSESIPPTLLHGVALLNFHSNQTPS